MGLWGRCARGGEAVRVLVRIVALAGLFLLMAPAQMLALGCWRRAARGIPLVFHRLAMRVMGFQIVVRSGAVVRGPSLVVANHISYLDILVLGSLVMGRFVSRAEVRNWPIIGVMARMQRTVFTHRRSGQLRSELRKVERIIEAGDIAILFPEATTGDGLRLLPFKSSLLDVGRCRDGRLPVQPISIRYSAVDGLPMTREWMPFFAWYGDMAFTRHILGVLGYRKVTVEVIVHPPCTLAEQRDRKALASCARQRIASGLACLRWAPALKEVLA